MLEGQQINLRPIEEKDLEIIIKWRNQQRVRRSFFTSSLLSYSSQKIWFDQYIKDPSREIFISELKDNYNPVGMIGLYQIDHRNHKAEIGSTIVGDQSLWGKGIGREMISVVLDYAFNDLHLNRVYAYALASNIGSIRVKEKCGFRKEGILREDFFCGGDFEDVVLLGITRKDWGS